LRNRDTRPCRMHPPIARGSYARRTRIAFSPPCLPPPIIATRCLRSTPSTWKSRACARSFASPWRGEYRRKGGGASSAGAAGGGGAGAPRGAGARLATITRYGLLRERFKALMEARRFDLYDEPMATLADLEAYAEGASASLIALAAQILAGGGEPDIGALSRHAGLAHAVAGLLAAFPIHAARGQLYIPLEILVRHGADRQHARGPPATAQF